MPHDPLSQDGTAPRPQVSTAPAGGEVVIDARDLVKDFGSLRALDHVDIQVHRGEMVGFLGVNGAGKSTAMKIITSYIPATSGSVTVCGNDVFYDSRAARRLIGYMPEVVPLYRDMRVVEYLTYRAKLKDVPWRERKRRVWGCMTRGEVEDRSGQIIGTLSRGYRQRVGLADALLGDPEILILDEPTAGLDPRQKVAFRSLIQGLAGEKTVFLSTHLLFELEDLGSRIIMIHNGRIVPEKRIQRLLARNEIYVTVRGEREAARKLLRGVGGVTRVKAVTAEAAAGAGNSVRFLVQVNELRGTDGSDVRERLAGAVRDGGFPLMELAMRRPTLEEVFVRITQRAGPEEEEEVA